MGNISGNFDDEEKPTINDSYSAKEEPVWISKDMLVEEKQEFRADFEKNMSSVPRFTLIIIAVNIIIWLWEFYSGACKSQETIIAAGALYRTNLLQGEYWRLVSAMFLHANFAHLISNCIMLYILGIACEHALGFKQTAVLYFVSGLCGSLLSAAMQPGPSVGASGAIFGVMASVIVFLYKYQKFFFVRDKRISIVLAIYSVYTIGTGFLTPFIDNFAHIGGLLGGATLTLYLQPMLLLKNGS